MPPQEADIELYPMSHPEGLLFLAHFRDADSRFAGAVLDAILPDDRAPEVRKIAFRRMFASTSVKRYDFKARELAEWDTLDGRMKAVVEMPEFKKGFSFDELSAEQLIVVRRMSSYYLASGIKMARELRHPVVVRIFSLMTIIVPYSFGVLSMEGAMGEGESLPDRHIHIYNMTYQASTILNQRDVANTGSIYATTELAQGGLPLAGTVTEAQLAKTRERITASGS
jgi:hypothetical protein